MNAKIIVIFTFLCVGTYIEGNIIFFKSFSKQKNLPSQQLWVLNTFKEEIFAIPRFIVLVNISLIYFLMVFYGFKIVSEIKCGP